MTQSAPIDGTLHRLLGHMVSETKTSTGTGVETKSTSALHPITLARPAEGRALTRVFCPSCQKNLGVIVASEAETLKYRKRCGRTAIVGLIAFLVLAPASALFIIHGGLACFAVFAIFGTLLGFFAAFFNTMYWLGHTGVFWAGETSPSLRNSHKILPADVQRRSYKVPFGPWYGPSK
jgi:hypothetical protein